MPDPIAGLQPPNVSQKLIPVFTSQELTRPEQACQGRSFAQRRDIAMFTATSIRLSELAGLRCSDVDLWQREITVRGKGSKDRIVKIGHQAARSLDRYQCYAALRRRIPMDAAGWRRWGRRCGRLAGGAAGVFAGGGTVPMR